MSALPNTLPRDHRKPAGRASKQAKPNKYGRDPLSFPERHRAQSDYDAETGYAPLYHSFFADLGRLTSGNCCTILVMYLWDRSAGRGARKGQPRPEWTLELSTEDLAQICHCDVRTIERELVALEKRGIGEVRRPRKGVIEARLKYRDWESLPDYKSPVTEMPAPEETVEEMTEADEHKPGYQRVTGKQAVKLAPGALSKAYPVSCGVKTFRHRLGKSDCPIDLEFSCVIQAGEVLVTSRFPEDWRKKVEIAIGRSNETNELTSPQRHGCRGDEANTGRNSAAVLHPRAGELIQLFDPILANSAARLLSGDSVALRKACEAIQDCDHDYLVKFAIQRAEKPVKAPGHVALICGEALASWKAGKSLDGTRIGERKLGFVEGVKEAARRRIEKYGRI